MLNKTICWLFIGGLMSFPLLAQQNLGRITGTVRDPSGAVIPGAQIRVENVATAVAQQTESNESGAFVLADLEVGIYKLTVTAHGFSTVEQSNMRIISGVTVTLDLTLSVGQTSQVVTVSGKTLAIDTQSSNAGITRVTEEISDLPLSIAGGARNSMGWMRTAPGVTWDPAAGGSPGAGADIITTETAVIQGVGVGLFTGGAGLNIDGIDATGNQYQPLREDSGPIPEAVAEFRIAGNPNADSGWNLGSSVELVMKSGTNAFHGQAFEYLRNTSLDARNVLAATRDVEKQNEFGGVIGGRIIRNRLFFFGSYDGFRYRTAPAGTVVSVPTAAMRQGDFSAFLGPQVATDSLGRPVYQGEIFDPLTTRPDGHGGFIRDPFMFNGALNVIDSARFSKFSQTFQKGYPLPNLPGLTNNWVGFPSPSPTTQDKISMKFDASLGAHRLFFGNQHILRKVQQYGAPLALNESATYAVVGSEYRYQASDTWVIRPNLLFNLRVGFVRFPRNIGTANLPNGSYGAEVGFPGVYTPDTPAQSITGYNGLGFSFRRYHDPGSNVPADVDVSWTKGSHSFKMGAQFAEHVMLRVLELGSNGSFSFGPGTTGMPNVPLSGVGYASYLLGDVTTGSLTTPEANRRKSQSWGLFVEDQWRATSRLTINYGLRWDFNNSMKETYDRFGVFSPDVQNPSAGGRFGALTFWGNGPGRNGRHSLVDPYFKAFGPRLGISYALNPKTVVRAYFGIAYNVLSSDYISLGTAAAYGWNASASRTSLDGFTPAFNWANGFPSGVIPPLPSLNPSLLNRSGVSYVNPAQNRPAMAERVGFGVERQLPGDMLVRADYLGVMVHGLSESDPYDTLPIQDYKLGTLLQADINSPQAQAAGILSPYPGFTGTVRQALLPYPQYTGVSYLNSNSLRTSYQSLEVRAQKRFGGGLSVLIGYTLSKDLWTASGPYPEYGRIKQLSPMDRPQNLSISYIYELPFGTGKRFLPNSGAFSKYLVGGWTLIGAQNYMSGSPVVLAGWYNRVLGQPLSTGVTRSNYDPHDPARNSVLNINAFQVPAPFTFGNTLSLSNFRTFGYLNENLSLDKSIPLGERVYMRISAQAFNIFNRVIYATCDAAGSACGSTLGTNLLVPSSFGHYANAYPPRNIVIRAAIDF